MKNFNRFEQIISIFFEYGFDYIVDETPLKDYIPFQKRLKKTFSKYKNIPFPVRLRLAFEKLGPSFLKFGQILSLRPDLIPEEYVKEFEKMLDKVPPFSYQQVEKIIEKELDKPINQLFKSFNPVPIASASISQVHKAVLKDGTVVAVKVQRPNIEEIMKGDIEIMHFIAKTLDDNFRKHQLQLNTIVTEFETWTMKELNFYLEAMHAERFRENFKNSPALYIPKVYEEFTSKRVMTSEFIDGIELNNIEALKKAHINLDKVVRNGYDALVEQIFVHGFFHGDPHPGNLLVMKDAKLVAVDFGIVGEFDEKLRKKAFSIFVAAWENDIDKMAKLILNLDPRTKKDNIDIQKFQQGLRDILAPLQIGSITHVKVSDCLMDALHLAIKYEIRIPIEFILYGKTLVTIEGIAVKYVPNFQSKKESLRVIKKLTKDQFSPEKAMENLKRYGMDLLELEESIPDYTKDVLERLKSGKVNVDIENQDINSFTDEFEHLSGNISFGIIVGSLLIGSSMIYTLTDNRKLAIFGFFMASLMGYWLVRRTVLPERKI